MNYHADLQTPLGAMRIRCTLNAITALEFVDVTRQNTSIVPEIGTAPADNELIRSAQQQLHAYFEGNLKQFDLPLSPDGSPFQRSVWNELLQIPYGKTSSYDKIGRLPGKAGAARAVGAANGANPIAIIIPCHRVIASDGALHGYAGGLYRKEKLLQLEGVLPIATLFDAP